MQCANLSIPLRFLFRPNPEEFVSMTTTGFAVPYVVGHVRTPYSLRIKVKVPCHTPSDSKFLVGSLKQRRIIWQLAKLVMFGPLRSGATVIRSLAKVDYLCCLAFLGWCAYTVSAEVDLPPKPSAPPAPYKGSFRVEPLIFPANSPDCR